MTPASAITMPARTTFRRRAPGPVTSKERP